MKYFLYCFTLTWMILGCNSTSSSNSSTHQSPPNELINETSPYLLQHAYNPVKWYPWGKKALEKAKAENKMIIVSVGYSSCHWCHVMEHESFEDSLVSAIMNEHFVSIKVDREERPDVDDVYMTACHLASGRSCGWPLNAFALPDGRPVWAGTYFPKNDWINVLNTFVKRYREEPQEIEKFANQLTEGVQQQDDIVVNTEKSDFTESELATFEQTFIDNIDFKDGGRKGAPKFPMPNNYDFLLNQYHSNQNPKTLEAVETTLDKMAMGGIYDHLGGGFARYSTDETWLVPHFEKMLYDNAQLVSLYAHAYQLSKKPLYKKVIEETLAFVQREMTDKTGGFYTALDADSEGEEGKFYVWTDAEIDSLVGQEPMADQFKAFYQIEKQGNWEHRKNIIHQKQPLEDFAKKEKTPVETVFKQFTSIKGKLFNARSSRIRPGLDDKMLTSWNALMLAGYVDAYKALGKKAYLDTALKNADFLAKNMMQPDGTLWHNYKNGKASINGFLDDYALLAQAFTGLYEITFDEQWLYKAKALTDYAIQHFYDEPSKMFYYTSNIGETLVARKKEIADNVIPASNSVMANNLMILGTYFDLADWKNKSADMLHNVLPQIKSTNQATYYSNWLQVYQHHQRTPYEIAIVGPDAPTVAAAMMSNFTPNAIYLGGKNEGTLELLKHKLQDGATMIYVCQNKVCKFPVEEPEKAMGLMKIK